ncbi:hypothetical protein [Micromonospora phaseoli]|nr:hypothetical protein [Micromonospora phaseoli]
MTLTVRGQPYTTAFIQYPRVKIPPYRGAMTAWQSHSCNPIAPI